jgi:hypothetical protein
MVEALGLTLPPKSLDEEDEEEYSPAELKCVIRNKIIFEERSKGSTIPEICEKLREKGYPTSQRWIWQILHSEKAGQFTEELERVQFRDIALLRAFALQTDPNDPKSRPDLKAFAAAINARGLAIRNMKPNEKVNVEVNVQQKQSLRVETANLLAEYEQVLAEATEAQTGNIQTNNP